MQISNPKLDPHCQYAFAIRNVRTGKYLYGTDYRYHSYRQRTDYIRLITYKTRKDAEIDMQCRQCGKDYKVVYVAIFEMGEGKQDEKCGMDY